MTKRRMMRIGEFRGVPWRGLLAAGAVVLALSVGLVGVAGAATRFVATSGTDSSNTCLSSGAPCKTITHALTQAVTSDTIQVAAGTYNLALGETFPLTINKALTLTGAGAGSTILDATGANFTVISIASGVTVTIAGVTIMGGHVSCTASGSGFCGAFGGGLFNNGTLTLTNTTVSGNTVSSTASGGGSGDAFGGGVFNNGTLTVLNATVTANTVACSPILCTALGGGLHNSGTLTLTNTTVSGNTVSCNNSGGGCSAEGGGLYNQVTLTVTASTVTANTVACSATSCFAVGGGLGNTGTATLHNTIVARQLTGADCANSGTLTSNGFNLDSNNTCQLTQPSDKPNVSNPLLGPLQNNGGPTQTHALLPGSPAIDTGTNTGCPSTDQRGITRPQGSACDIGAFELVSTSSPGPTGPANARQILNVGTFVGPTAPPTPQQQQQTFRPTDPLLAGATYYNPADACLGVPPAGAKLFVFTLEGQLILGRNRDTGGVSSTQIGTSKYQALLATLDPGALPAGSYNLVFWVKDCTDTAVLVSEFSALQVLSP